MSDKDTQEKKQKGNTKQRDDQKVLLTSLRKSLPNKVSVKDFRDKIVKHGYQNVNFFNKINSDHRNYSWAKRNLEGELYEAQISEVLLDWAKRIKNANQFVMKDPYVKTNEVDNGFGYDKRRITLFGDGDPLAEFDALFQYKNKWFFVEITSTTNRKNLKSFLQDIARKRKILKLVFNCKEVYSLIVTIVPNLFNPGDLSTYDLNYYFPFNDELLTLIPSLSKEGQIIGFSEDNKKLILTNQLEYNDFDYKQMRKNVRRQFNRYYKGKITSEEFIAKTQDTHGIVQNITLGKLSKTAIHDLNEIGLLKEKYKGFSKKRIKRIVVGIKLELGKKAQLRLYVIPVKMYNEFLPAFYWKDNQFRIRDKVLCKSCILKTYDPVFDAKDKLIWEQLGKASNELKIPKLV
ncbi:MAG: hypothetical protein GPJ52_03875 [Candidatus Heimdallarchaeota archaeon]|nr:hypothetical protein [Candidatus Heimdallarchaeota archaeon]